MNQPSYGATLKDVARAAGVSVATASRALTGSHLISSATSQKVQKAAAELAYRPNAQARALRKATTNTLGVIIPDITNEYFSMLAAAIETAAAQCGYVVMLSNSSDNADRLENSVRVLCSHRVDGIIAVPLVHTESIFAHLKDQSVPFVFVDRDLISIDAWSVNSDPRPGMVQAVRRLVAMGHKSIGFLSGPLETSTGSERRKVFEEECAASGVRDCPIIEGTFRKDSGYEGARELLRRGIKAVVAGDSMNTLGALAAFHDLEIEVGRDVEIIGFDNMLAFELQPHPLSVIDQHVDAMGVRAFELLREQMSPSITVEELNSSRRERIATTLIERGVTSRVCLDSP